MPDVENTTTIMAGLDASDYVAGAAAIIDANAKIAASGAPVVAATDQVTSSISKSTRTVLDGGAGYERFLKQMDPAYAASQRFAAVQGMMSRSVDAGRVSQERANELLSQFSVKLGITRGEQEGFALSSHQSEFAVHSLTTSVVAGIGAFAAGAPIVAVLTSEITRLTAELLLSRRGFTAVYEKFGEVVTLMGGPWMASGIAGFIGLGAALVYMGFSAEGSATELLKLQNTLSATRDDYAALSVEVTKTAEHIASTTGISGPDARAAVSSIAAVPQWGGTEQQMTDMVKLANELGEMMGVTLPEAAKKWIVEGFENPAKAADDLSGKLKGFDPIFAKHLSDLLAAGKSGQAFADYLDKLKAATGGVVERLTPLQQSLHDLGVQFDGTSEKGSAFVKAVGGVIDTWATGAIEAIRGVIEAADALYRWTTSHQPSTAPVSGQSLNPLSPNYQTPMQRLQAAQAAASAGGNPSVADTSALPGQIAAASATHRLDPTFMTALQRSENAAPDAAGNWAPSGTGPIGAFQVAPSTYSGMARDSSFPTMAALGPASDQTSQANNVEAGSSLMEHLLSKYGDVNTAVLAWHDGEPKIDAFLKGIGSPSKDAVDQANKITNAYKGTGLAGSGASPITSPSAVAGGGGFGVNTTATTDAASAAADTAIANSLAGKIHDNLAALALQHTALEQAKKDVDDANGDPVKMAAALAMQDKASTAIKLLTLDQVGLVSEQTKSADAATRASAALNVQAGAARDLAAITEKYQQMARTDPAGLNSVALNAELAAKQKDLAAAYRDTLKEATRTADEQVSVDKTTEGGAVAAQHAANALKAYDIAQKTAIPGTALFTSEQAALTEQLNRGSDALRTQAESRDLTAQQNSLDMIKLETTLIGATTEARQTAIETLKLYQQWGLKAGDTLDAAQQKELANIPKISAAQAQLTRDTEANAANMAMVGQAMDTIGTSISDSLLPAKGQVVDWGETMQTVSRQVLESFLKLQVIKPLMASLFGGDSGGGGAGGIGSLSVGDILGKLGGLFGGSGGGADGGLTSLPIGGMTSVIDETPWLAAASGGVFPGRDLHSYEGSVVSQPTQFRFAAGGQVGLMGEAGDEAILPLRRGRDGKLGVSMADGTQSPSITLHIHGARDPDTFKRSAPQILRAALTAQQRAASRN